MNVDLFSGGTSIASRVGCRSSSALHSPSSLREDKQIGKRKEEKKQEHTCLREEEGLAGAEEVVQVFQD